MSELRHSRIVMACCEQEQQWNEQQLREPAREPLIRLWHYSAPGIVLGRSQQLLAQGSEGADASRVSRVVRQSGGGAVLVGPWMLGASIILPNSHRLAAANLADSYCWLGQIYAQVLRQIGVHAHAMAPQEARSRQQQSSAEISWACFGGFSPWEVIAADKKIVGLAQARPKNGILFVAGLLVHTPDWLLLTQQLNHPPVSATALAKHTTSCEQQLGQAPSVQDIACRLLGALDLALL